MSDTHGYDGDEEFTPSERITPKLSAESKAVANIAIAYSTIGNRLLDASRLLDSTSGDQRRVYLAKLVAELKEAEDASCETRRALTALMGGMP